MLDSEYPWVNPETLRRLREGSRWTIPAAAKESKKLAKAHFVPVSAEQLQQWEAGQGAPDLEQLETLSELYRCPVGYFFLAEPLLAEHRLSFRGLASGKEKDFGTATLASLRRFVELAEWFVAMIEEHAIDWAVQLPSSRGPARDPTALAQDACQRLGVPESRRNAWNSAEDAFNWWRRRIERQGVFCFELKLDPKDVRGASLWINNRYPFILVNRQDAEASTGRLFTLLHEFGHVLLERERQGIVCDFGGRDRSQRTETLVNRFASQVLLPAHELEQLLREQHKAEYREHWSDAELRRLATPFCVSRDVVAILLEQLHLAPTGFYMQRRVRWQAQYARRKPWGRGRNPKKWQRKVRELGHAGLRVILRLHSNNTLPALDAAYLLDTKVEKLNQFMEEFRAVVQEE